MFHTTTEQYDLILLGATGYTGRLCAEHICTSLPTDLNWAIAGRSETKLSALKDKLKAANKDRADPGLSSWCHGHGKH